MSLGDMNYTEDEKEVIKTDLAEDLKNKNIIINSQVEEIKEKREEIKDLRNELDYAHENIGTLEDRVEELEGISDALELMKKYHSSIDWVYNKNIEVLKNTDDTKNDWSKSIKSFTNKIDNFEDRVKKTVNKALIKTDVLSLLFFIGGIIFLGINTFVYVQTSAQTKEIKEDYIKIRSALMQDKKYWWDAKNQTIYLSTQEQKEEIEKQLQQQNKK